jgi:hypothetical protein
MSSLIDPYLTKSICFALIGYVNKIQVMCTHCHKRVLRYLLREKRNTGVLYGDPNIINIFIVFIIINIFISFNYCCMGF